MEPPIALSPNRRGTSVGPSPVGSVELPGLLGRFCLFYQPELALGDGSIHSCEALLRWWHPDFGMMRPGLSLSGTRWNERISGIEDWAVAEVCRQGAAWAAAGSPIQIALNVSRHNLVSGRFLESVEEALASSGLDPASLAVDVPFRVLATDPARLHRLTDAAADLGVSVVIDGVGPGASFDALDTVTADAWKVDVYTRGLRHTGLHPSVSDALARAHQIGVLAIAKQVEDEDVVQELTRLGYDRAFGHAISPPVTAQALAVIMKHGVARQRPLFTRA